MRKLVLTCLTSCVCVLSADAQALFTYGTRSVSKEEFLRVYKKNSINKKPDMSDTALRSYLNLYALFRMKVAEADKQQLDTVATIDNELNNYRKQLAKNYLTDEQITTKLYHEAYDRMKEDVRIAHIMISCPPGTDTTSAYRKIDSISKAIESGKATFEAMAKEFSDDKGSKDNGGEIGYITAMKIVYPIESMAYNTPVGKISKPFKSQFGYHIMKVIDRRPSRGQIKVAQIMIRTPKSKGEEGIGAARLRADSVLVMLKNGQRFSDLVMKYSEDQYSVKDSGVLKPFGAGDMVAEFENAAFALKKPGDVSAPVRTEYGFHIIKLIEKYPIKPYDTVLPQIKHKVDNDSRAAMAKEAFFNKVKEKNGFKEYPENVKEISAALAAIPDTGANAKTVNAKDYKNMVKPVFVLAGKNYLQIDFASFFEKLTHGKLNGPKETVIRDAYNLYVSNVVNDFQEHKLVEENPDFRNLMQEYRDGIMLFELMDRNVWSKAARDSAGLTAFYESHKSKYMWEPGFEGAVYRFKNKAMFDSGMNMLKAGVTDENIVKELNTSAHPDAVSVQRGRYEFSRFKEATQAELINDKMKISLANGQFSIINAKEIFTAPGQKSLSEARGYVVAEYQDYLEKQWNEKMRHDYPLKVNEAVFKTMVKK